MKLISCILLLTLPFIAKGQSKPAPEYPQDYFRNPLDIPIFLAGNFGECRPGHFHSGVDIKTQGKENLPVHAAAAGYISRIKMEKGGFGHGLYVTHPGGYTTLYAHLNDFAPEVQKYVRREQYAKKRWDVELSFNPEQFPLKKGQLIAYSGNTGASTAPHLHFEIRNSKTEHPLNPELFGLPVVDNIAATPIDVALYDLGKSIYEQEAVIIPLKKNGDKYAPVKNANNDHVDNGTVITDYVVTGIGINVDDYMNGSDNTISFLTARLYLDDSLQSEVRLDNIGYDETRYINAYTDYKTRTQRHKWIQCLFKLPGDHLDSIYRYLNNRMGGLTLAGSSAGAGNSHEVRIVITDDKGNASTVSFPMKLMMGPRHPDVAASNTARFAVGETNSLNDPNVMFSLDGKQLYDNINFVFAKTPDATAYSDKYQLHYPFVPLHHYFDLQIKPNKTIPLALRSKVVMMYSDNKDEDGRAATFGENGWYKAKVRNFGTYWLDIDTTAPVVHGMQKNGANLAKAKQIAIEVKDAVTSVKSYSGYIDGKWVCFEQHGNTCFYKFDEHCGAGKHRLVFKAEDENGNEAVYELSFTR